MPNVGFRSYSNHTVGATRYKGEENPITTLPYGVEIEVEPATGSYNAEISAENMTGLLWDIVGDTLYYKRDGSLSGDGFEVISEPCSLAYHMYSMRWKHVMKTLVRGGFRSHQSRNCGLHVHVGRRQLGETDEVRDEVIRKLKLFLSLNWTDVVTFTRRRGIELDRWAHQELTASWVNDRSLTQTEWESRARFFTCWNDHDGRYRALNNDINNQTIEFRIFKGTLKRDTFIATLQFCDELIKWAQSATWYDVRNATFLTPFINTQHAELRAYLVNRGLLPSEQLGELRRQPEFGGVDGVQAVA